MKGYSQISDRLTGTGCNTHGRADTLRFDLLVSVVLQTPKRANEWRVRWLSEEGAVKAHREDRFGGTAGR